MTLTVLLLVCFLWFCATALVLGVFCTQGLLVPCKPCEHPRTPVLCMQEQVARMVEAQDARLRQVESEAAEKGREARRHQAELQAKLDALKETCEGALTSIWKSASKVRCAERDL